jgi:Tfp pilus assembly protein PilF
LKESGHVGAAEMAYRRSLSLSPDTADTHLHLGHVLKLQGRMDEAATAYLRSAVLDPALCHPRDESIGLGWTRERIEQSLRASASANSGVPGGG